jgi:hypothetical protein
MLPSKESGHRIFAPLSINTILSLPPNCKMPPTCKKSKWWYPNLYFRSKIPWAPMGRDKKDQWWHNTQHITGTFASVRVWPRVTLRWDEKSQGTWRLKNFTPSNLVCVSVLTLGSLRTFHQKSFKSRSFWPRNLHLKSKRYAPPELGHLTLF